MFACIRYLLFALAFAPVVAHAVSDGVIDGGEYGSDAAARDVWVAKEGAPAAAARRVAGRAALALSCPFSDKKLKRGVWDREVTLDLSQAEGAALEIFCPKAGISSFSFYFKSGNGWYSGSF